MSAAQHQSTAGTLMLGNGPPDAFGSQIFYSLAISGQWSRVPGTCNSPENDTAAPRSERDTQAGDCQPLSIGEETAADRAALGGFVHV